MFLDKHYKICLEVKNTDHMVKFSKLHFSWTTDLTLHQISWNQNVNQKWPVLLQINKSFPQDVRVTQNIF